VKYLQITRNLKHLNALHWNVGISDARKVARYPLPKIYEKYISMKVTLPGRSVPVSIIDFCQRGTQFQSPEPLEPGGNGVYSHNNVHIKKEVHFRMMNKILQLKRCWISHRGSLDEVDDSSEFNFFNNISDFIVEHSKKRPPFRRLILFSVVGEALALV